MSKARIVVLGGGYAGLMTVTKLQRKLNVEEAEIILVNKHDYHYETTWLHETSAGTIQRNAASYCIKNILNNKKVTFVKATAQKVDEKNKKVILSTGEISYDYLVIALGGESETFGIKGLREHAYFLESLNASVQIKEQLETQFAQAKLNKEKTITITVCGAGFTGIEFLGEVTSRIKELSEKYEIEENRVKVMCIEAQSTILPGFEESLITYAKNFLTKRGVTFHLGTSVKECTEEGLIITNKEETILIPSSMIIWTAGIRGNRLMERSELNSTRGRIEVDENLMLPQNDHLFIIGDCSIVINEKTNLPYPPTAQIALQQGIACANNIVALIRNQPMSKFVPSIKGMVCSLGNRNGVGVVYNIPIKGLVASFMKKVIDNKANLQIGGISLFLKKLKINFF